MKKVLIWDIPTRLFHWSMVICFIMSIVTMEVEALQDTDLHVYSGYTILTLVLFRAGWGIVGGFHARFRNFLTGPGPVLDHLRELLQVQDDHAHASLGHNPAGGWVIIIILLALLIQALTGLFANDDILFEGPLAYLVSDDMSSSITGFHHLLSKVLIALGLLHIAAVIFYQTIKHQQLVVPMITGFRMLDTHILDTHILDKESPEEMTSVTVPWWHGLLLLAASIGVVYAVTNWF